MVAELVLSYLRVLTWPLVVVLVLLLFRKQIGRLVGSIKEIEGFGLKATLGEQVADTAAQAEQALDDYPFVRAEDATAPLPGVLAQVADALEAALRVSEVGYGSYTVSGTGGPLSEARSLMDELDATLAGILIAVDLRVAQEGRPDLSAWPIRRDVAAVETHLVRLTGYRGWGGVVLARNRLRLTLSVVCVQGERTVGPQEARRFTAVARNVVRRLHELARTVIASAERAGDGRRYQ
ncbi:hypothetical protein [Sphaerisporangium aureirubrum]|uniref:Uncharacterized protein n=1 Tax=Sphaerisporangium aureirubrum TaxID=1544736 RepID=A0ABW1NUC8_9ACTN